MLYVVHDRYCNAACTLLLQVVTASQTKDSNNGLWEWLVVGVVIINNRTIDVKPERAVPAAVMAVSMAL